MVVSVANFRLFFGKYKGQVFSNTPKDYQSWLITQPFFKQLKIRPMYVRKKNMDGVWREVDIIEVEIKNPNKNEND